MPKASGITYGFKRTTLKTDTIYYSNSSFFNYVDNFEAGVTDWSGSASTTLSDETSIVGTGSHSLKVVTTAAAQYVEYDGYSSTDLTDYDNTVVFWVRSLKICTLTARLEDGSSETLTSSVGVSVSATELKNWKKIELTLDTDSGSFDPEDVEKLRIIGLPDTSTIYIDSVWNGSTTLTSTFQSLTFTTTEPVGSTVKVTLYKNSDDSVISGFENLTTSDSPVNLKDSGITYDMYAKVVKEDTRYPINQGTLDSFVVAFKPSYLGDRSGVGELFAVVPSNNEFIENIRDTTYKDVGLTTANWNTTTHLFELTGTDLTGDIVSKTIYYNQDPTKNVRAVNIVPTNETIPSGGSIAYYVSPDKDTWQLIVKETVTDLTTSVNKLYFKVVLTRASDGDTITVGDNFKIILVVE